MSITSHIRKQLGKDKGSKMQRVKALSISFLLLSYTVTLGAEEVQQQQKPVDMTTLLHDSEGKTIKDSLEATPEDPQCKNCSELTVGKAIAHALLWSAQGDERISVDQKFSRGLLAEKLRSNKAAILEAGETAAIGKLLARLYGPLVVLPVIQAIDPNFKVEKLQ